MIWIIGGTSEATELAKAIQGKFETIVSVATETGREFLPESRVRIGRMNSEEMVAFISQNHISAIVDASHPYATEVSENARAAQKQAGIQYIRYSRPKETYEGATVVNSLTECLQLLQSLSGCVFFTTGSNQIKQFENCKGNNRYIYRILPTPESTEECRKNGVALKDIVAALGPFSTELNKAMFEAYGTDYVVMKNSGKRGGTEAKIEACKQLGITPVIIERENEIGFTDLERLIEYVMSSLQNRVDPLDA